MENHHLVLLPGLDGTGDLFAPFLEALPPNYTVTIVSFAVNESLDYSQLLQVVEEQIPQNRDFTVLAESFSGPLALFYATNNPVRLKKLILCASFVTSPVNQAFGRLQRLIGAQIFSMRAPNWVLRYFLLGLESSDAILSLARSAIQQVAPGVMAQRVQQVIDVDARDALRKCKQPMLYIRASKDAIVRRQSWQTIKDQRPDVEYQEIDGPHLLLQTKPREAMVVINDFLQNGKVS